MPTPQANLFQQALAHHQAGRLGPARAAYEQVLAAEPNHADALHMLGVVNAQEGRPDAAVQLIHRALRIKPRYPEALTNLALALTALGRVTEAADALKKAAELQPNDPLVHFHQAETLLRVGRIEEARAAYARTVQLNPNFAAALVGLGVTLGELDRVDEATRALDRAIELAPNDAMAYQAKGIILHRHPAKMHEATDTLRRAVELAPQLAAAWNALGSALRAMGQLDEAARCFARASELRPDIALFATNLASITKAAGAAVDAQVAPLLAVLSRPDASELDRVGAGFAVGKLLDEAGRFDDAFGYFATANARVKQQAAAHGDRFDSDLLRRQIDQIIARFTPAFFQEHRDWGNPSQLPVFIVGMPRSGTTLVEQIAASHPAVVGAGELKDIDRISAGLGRDPAGWTRAAIAAAAAQHLERLQAIARDHVAARGGGDEGGAVQTQRVVDKMMGNAIELGLIATMFPGARVIICRRDPRDNCLSCFFQHFASGNLFTYDLADCGHRYMQIERLLEYWQRVLPLPMLEVQYEQLVADLPGQTRRLIDFLGLAWDPACLEFHRTPRAMTTATAWQVRRPIYRDAVGRWRNYQRHLQPLLDVLGASGTGLSS
ncbi:MAG TPA: sulfotransferase [Tepidisphaeraceae bacterium]|nr:sulfotransferase [Tepidisphaeraceae bacterium]